MQSTNFSFSFLLFCVVGLVFVTNGQITGNQSDNVVKPAFVTFNDESATKYQYRMSGDPRLMYPYTTDDYVREINSMKQFHDQPLPFRLPFFGFAYHYIWIHKDGYVCFNRGLKSYEFPLSFPAVPDDPEREEDPSMMAIFFAHQDIPSSISESGVYLRIELVDQISNPDYKQMILDNFKEAMAGSGGFTPKFIIIVTWKNMTFANRRYDRPLKTNTYQMVIGTDEKDTFVFFNYEWITWITHLDNYDGLNGPAAYVGFNAGNSTRSHEFAPYSQNPRISLLPLIGYANNIPGRAVFQVHDVLFQGSCVDKSLDPTLPDRMGLTTSVNYISSLGGELLEVTGPCFWPNSRITCRFDSILVKGHYLSTNVAICVTPLIMFEGFVDLIVTVDDKTYFYTRMYIQSPESRREFDVWVDPTELIEKNPDTIDEEPEQILTIKWKTDIGDEKDPVTIGIWAYQELDQTLYPRVYWILDLTRDATNSGEYQLDLNQLPSFDHLKRYDYHFGFIGVNITGRELSMTEWSQPMPLGWLLRHYWRREFGQTKWQRNFCQKWFEREDQNEYFATTLFRCPCTLAQALHDKGRFAPDERCNVVDKKCDQRHLGAQHCVRTARPSIGGSGQQCCYDDYGELIRSADTMYSGRPSRTFIYGKHPFKMQMQTPTLSYWQHDVMPFYYCCKWQPKEDDSETCMMFNYFRTTQDCSSYQPPAIASVFGDPHIITFDRTNYTFNGRGEYSLVHANNPIHKLDIHGRFERLPGHVNATQLTAVSVRDNVSSIVEFRIRPDGCRWFNQIFIIADKEYLYYWDDNMRTIHTRGVSIYQPSGIRNMSHLIAMFDSGAGVEVLVNSAGTLTMHVYLPLTYVNSTQGLLGYYSNDPNDDFMLPNGWIFTNGQDKNIKRIHEEFGIKYRLLETAQQNISQSLFFHDVLTHSQYDDVKFLPQFDLDPKELEHLNDVDRICSNSLACQFDYLATGDSGFAENTKKEEAIAENMYLIIAESIIRCPALNKPINGRKSENRYWPGTIVRFSCLDGYRLLGYEVRRCREDGLWSWGEDPFCMPVIQYNIQLLFTYLIPIIVTFLAIYMAIFFLKHRQQQKHKMNNTSQRRHWLLSRLMSNFTNTSQYGGRSSYITGDNVDQLIDANRLNELTNSPHADQIDHESTDDQNDEDDIQQSNVAPPPPTVPPPSIEPEQSFNNFVSPFYRQNTTNESEDSDKAILV
nr:protein mesh-like isoform X1 [Dermatophagoides farinae]